MKTFKKTVTWLCLALLVVSALIGISGNAEAVTPVGGNGNFTGLTASDLDGATYKYVNAGEIDMTINGVKVVFNDSTPTDSFYNFKSRDSTMFCDGTVYGHNGLADKIKGISVDKNAATVIQSKGESFQAVAALDYIDSSGQCQTYENQNLVFTRQSDGTYAVAAAASGVNQGDACTGGSDCKNNVCQVTGGDCTTSTSAGGGTCEVSAAGFSLAWLLCPTLDAADSLATSLTGLFEDQLSFHVSDLSGNKGQASLQSAWALIRDLATAALVIVMLIMVISQAVGGGPFDAYTVRKMLPRLVAAIILMQVSWYLLGWVVDVFDDLGEGLKQLLYTPFQPGNLDDFWALLQNAHVTTAAAGVTSWAALVGAGIGVVLALPTILMFCFIAVISVLTGLAVLVFRKILIVMALLLAPIGILAWIVPGTQKYFKLWYDNLLKALFMFPLAIGLIAAGRIFAYVVGGTKEGTFINFFLVIVGFFGPLFLLPKTFKWGGSAMKSVGDAAFKASTKLQERPNKYFKARQEDWDNRRSAQSKLRVANGEGFNPKKVSSYYRTPLDKFRSHQWDPLLAGEMNRSSKRSKVMKYKEEGHKVEEEEQNLSDREASFEERRLNQSKYNHDHLWQDKADGELRNYQNHDGAVDVDDLSEDERNGYDRYSEQYFSEWQKRHPGGTQEQFKRRKTISYAERDFYAWKKNNQSGSYDQFQNDKDAFGYKDYSGKVVSVHKPEDKYERNSALNMLAKFGGPNHPMLVRYLYQELGAGGKREQDIREWMQDHSEFILKVYPQLLKGLSSTATQPSFAGMHQIGYRDQTGRLMWEIENARTPEARASAQKRLRQQVSNLVSNMSNPAEKNGIETDIRVLMKAIADNDTTTIGRINGEIQQMRYQGGVKDRRTGGDHPPEISTSSAIMEALGSGPLGDDDLLAKISSMLDKNGGYRTEEGPPPSPPPGGGEGELDIHPEDHGGGPTPPMGRPGMPPGRPTLDGGGGRYAGYGASSPMPAATASTAHSESPAPAAESASTGGAPDIDDSVGSGSIGSVTTSPVTRVTQQIIHENSPTTIVMPTSVNSTQTPVGGGEARPNHTAPPANPYSPGGPLDRRAGEELDYQLRRMYRELKKMGSRDQEQQRQLDDLRSQHPDWDNDDDGQNT